MKKQQIMILNKEGIHARPASMIVQLTQQFDSEIWIQKKEKKIDAKSIMDILALGATYKTKLTIIAEGRDEENAVSELVHLFEKEL